MNSPSSTTETSSDPPRRPLALIVAMAKNRCIGEGGGLPWHLPEDLGRFKRLTTGHAIIMGRKTYESIGRPLPKRRSIVVSRTADLTIEGCEVARSVGEAIERAYETDPLPFVIGGATVYEAALPRATVIELTEIDREVEGDTFFPPLLPEEWREASREAGGTEGVAFVTLVRIT